MKSEQLYHRLRAFSAWRVHMARYPGGLLPASMAARVLGVKRQRIYQLIAEQRLPTVELYPGSNLRLIPFDALMSAPTLMERGRPRDFSVKEGPPRRGPRPNPWGEPGGGPQPVGFFVPVKEK
ncbi:MAG: hypothetical protein ACKVW3_09555 [Phycisphaerales bacterium]